MWVFLFVFQRGFVVPSFLYELCGYMSPMVRRDELP